MISSYLSDESKITCNLKKTVIIGEEYIDYFEGKLNSMGVECISMPNNLSVDKRVSSHADISIFRYFGRDIFISSYFKNNPFVKNLEQINLAVHILSENQGKFYPEDSLLNICLLKNYIIYNPKSASKEIINYINNSGHELNLIAVNQGYTKCSVIVVNENSIITSDISIACKTESYLDTLLISPNNIKLKGYNYGFIGGCAFKLKDDTLCFTGKLDDFSTADKKRIFHFLDEHNVNPVFLTELPVFDIGGAIVI